jgi:flagellar basal-body rod modification protein FlgD
MEMSTVASSTSTNPMPADFLAAVNPKTKTVSDSSMQASEDRFLKLLTTQLQNQDPMNPMENAEMTSQMAQISTVTGIEKLNATLEKLISNSNDSQTMQAAAMLGRHVLVDGNSMNLAEDGQTIGAVDFPQPVDEAKLTIRDANGLLVRTLPMGAQEAGLNSFVWDGKNDAGVQAAAGKYSFSVSATQGGEEVGASTLQLAPVTGILRENTGVRLELGDLGPYDMAEIRQIY